MTKDDDMPNTQMIEDATTTTNIPLAERNVLEVLLCEPQLFHTAAEYIGPGDFTHPALQVIARHVWRLGSAGYLHMAELLAVEELADHGALLVDMAAVGKHRGNYGPTLTGAINHFVFRREHGGEIDALRAAGDDDSLRKLTELFRHHDRDVRGAGKTSSDSLVYLISPFSDLDPAVRQVRYEGACAAAAALSRNGDIVYSPIIESYPYRQSGQLTYLRALGFPFRDRLDRAILGACSSVVVLMLDGWDSNCEVQAELAVARELGLPIRHTDPAELQREVIEF